MLVSFAIDSLIFQKKNLEWFEKKEKNLDIILTIISKNLKWEAALTFHVKNSAHHRSIHLFFVSTINWIFQWSEDLVNYYKDRCLMIYAICWCLWLMACALSFWKQQAVANLKWPLSPPSPQSEQLWNCENYEPV